MFSKELIENAGENYKNSPQKKGTFFANYVYSELLLS
jgi:hypothetical protein